MCPQRLSFVALRYSNLSHKWVLVDISCICYGVERYKFCWDRQNISCCIRFCYVFIFCSRHAMFVYWTAFVVLLSAARSIRTKSKAFPYTLCLCHGMPITMSDPNPIMIVLVVEQRNLVSAHKQTIVSAVSVRPNTLVRKCECSTDIAHLPLNNDRMLQIATNGTDGKAAPKISSSKAEPPHELCAWMKRLLPHGCPD